MAQAATTSIERSFAGVLASMATPAAACPTALQEEPDWIDDGLLDDVAVISTHPTREPALHSQMRTTDADVRSTISSDAAGPTTNRNPRELKSASITIRLSAPECAQLKARAAESGLTISEYLRSCTLEVENLRSQVKEAVATMRARAEAEKMPVVAERPSLFGRMTHFWPRPRAEYRATSR